MSNVELRVELPTHNHSFAVNVELGFTILEVKEQIYRTCPGGPRPTGQRIIYRGRYLRDDEKVGDIWKSQDARIVHLSVHPSAWESQPPSSTSAAPAPTTPLAGLQDFIHTPLPPPMTQPASPPPTPSPNSAHSYLRSLHQAALQTLIHARHLENRDPETSQSRILALQLVERSGWTWPSILDEPYPHGAGPGVKYEQVVIDGQPFLSLRESDTDQPNAAQLHALNVLSYTFVLLKLPMVAPVISRSIPSQTVPIPPHVNQVLQQMGLPPLPNQNAAPAPDLNRINIELRNLLPQAHLRPLLFPLGMMIFRTLLLLYFFAPARKPVMGLIILGCLAYELWHILLPAGAREPRQEPRPEAARDAAAPPQPVRADNHLGDAAQPGGPAAPAGQRNQVNQPVPLMDALANVNLDAEERALSGHVSNPPTLTEKMVTFFGLLATTVHPAVWDRRRAVLRRREGQVRTETTVREQADEEGESEARTQRRAELVAQHARRPGWVQDYIRRVEAGDWVDDAD